MEQQSHASHVPVTCKSHDPSLPQALAFFITQMDAVVNSPFIVIYLNTGTVEENVYDSEFYKQLYLSVDDRYLDHLKGLYIVHPSFWLKVSTRSHASPYSSQYCDCTMAVMRSSGGGARD